MSDISQPPISHTAAAPNRGSFFPDHAKVDTDSLLKISQQRRNLRADKTAKVSEQQLATILEAARWATAGANTQPWEFVVAQLCHPT